MLASRVIFPPVLTKMSCTCCGLTLVASLLQRGVHASALGPPFSLLEQSRVAQDVCRLFMYRAGCYSMLQEPFYIAHDFDHVLVLNVDRLTVLYFNK